MNYQELFKKYSEEQITRHGQLGIDHISEFVEWLNDRADESLFCPACGQIRRLNVADMIEMERE